MQQPLAVEVRNVTKVIGGKEIIKNLSLSVRSGEIYGFLGPNGAGKTTTIRMIVGLISITKGDILVQGNSIRTHRKEAMEQIGAIVENPELYRYMTGRQNLIHFANMSSKNITNERMEEIIHLVQLEDAIDRKVKTYSLGMRQRLGIAQALLHRPAILILDEPTNGLDPAGIRQLRDYLQQLARSENMAVLVSSHLLSEIELMCDRVIIIQNGRFVAERSLKQAENQIGVRVNMEVTDQEKTVQLLQQMGHIPLIQNPLTIETSKEHIPVIVQKLVQHGVGIVQVVIRETALEDIFLNLTEEA
ncbi:ABC transporter ATP-binding protein [Paenibacillus sp. RC67]|uniref:ABC transporter ATP-binding protein n=1 Tax=Paenibacillus sp. RC67 TaxID=3039392 RepID=UPI0024AD7A20|nr:ABC transporter ATP-binding protein [Paenibacillus sp. RC67]